MPFLYKNDDGTSRLRIIPRKEGKQETTPSKTDVDDIDDSLMSQLVSSFRAAQKLEETKEGSTATAQRRETSGLPEAVRGAVEPKLVMLGLLWFIACLSALDRVAMSVALLPMSAEFDFSDSVKGSISSLFSVGYGLAILPAGLLVADLSPRLVMAAGLAAWSVATIATPFAAAGVDGDAGSCMVALLAARALVGAGESVILPTLQRLLSAWTTAEEKSTALAAVYSGFNAGTIAAYIVSPMVMDAGGGWRGLFYCYGAIGLAILVPWLAFAQDRPYSDSTDLQMTDESSWTTMTLFQKPTSIASSSSATSALATSKLETTSLQDNIDSAMQTFHDAPWKDFAESKGTWALSLAHCVKNWGLYIALAWTPTFYSEQYGIGVRDSAWFSVLPSIVGAASGIAFGTAADALLRKLDASASEKLRCNVRKGFQSFSFLGQALVLSSLAWHLPEDPALAQFYLTASYGLMASSTAGFEAGIQEKAGEKWSGLMYSVTTLPAVMVGTAGVYLTGRILDVTHQDWSVVFGLNAAVNVLGALAFLTLYDSKREFD